jgi:hypothetical protein
MKTISQLLSDSGSKSSYSTYQLQGNGGSKGIPASHSETPLDNRIDPARLENAWRRVPSINNGINKMTQMIMSKNWSIEGENEEFFQDFVESVGRVGTQEDFNSMLEAIFRYQLIYGEHYVELVEAEEDGSIVDLKAIDPKRMDYAMEGNSRHIALDRFGTPVGYAQELPFGYQRDKIDQIHEIPDKVVLNDRHQIFFPRDRIAHFKLYTYGEGFYPVGLIEPAFLAAERRTQLEEDFSDKAHNGLFPLRYASVGDERHEPTPDEIDEVLTGLRNSNSRSEAAFPYHVDLEVLEVENPESMIQFFEHFDEEIIKSLGIPKSIAQGEATRVNRASLQSQIRVWEVSMMDIIQRTTNTIEKQIFAPIAEEEGFDDYPDFKFTFEVDPRHQIERATRFRGDIDAAQAPQQGGGLGGGEYPDLEDQKGMVEAAINAMKAGINPEDLGITPDMLGIEDEDNFDNIDIDQIKAQAGGGGGGGF